MGIANFASQSLITIPEVGLTEIENEPRVRDIDLGERLGFEHPRQVRRLIKQHESALAGFGEVCTAAVQTSGKGGRPSREFWLNEGQALYIASKSDAPVAPAVLTMLINVFVAYRRGHLVENPVAVLDEKTKSAIGGIVKNCTALVVREQLAAALPAMLDSMVAAKLAEQNFLLRRGKTAGQIWREAGFPRIRVTSWFSNRLCAMKCQIDGGGRGELGLGTAKLFDPDKASVWLRNGGRKLVEEYVASRKGQGRLRLVGGGA